MSKIALEGNASGTGTFTIASPNSNSNYTLTLPSSTGTVVVTGGAQTIEFAAGTAAAPSITFTGDTNTGIFSPAADTIAFSEGGAESMRITSAGNVGIGTTSPGATLDVRSSGSAAVFRTSDGTAANNAGTWIYNTASGTAASRVANVLLDGNGGDASGSDYFVLSHYGDNHVEIRNYSNGYMNFYTNNTERMRIDSSGNVGIGTSSPAAKLDVDQSTTGTIARFRAADNAARELKITSSTTTNNGDTYTLDATSGSGVVAFATTSTERARINSNGNLLVGTTTAGAGAGYETRLAVDGGTAYDPCMIKWNGAATSAYVLRLWNTATTGDNLFAVFQTEGTPTDRGNIRYNRGSGVVAYNTSSDANLKNIIGDSDGKRSLEILSTTRLREFAWKDDPNQYKQIGVIAQELYETYPGAVTVGGDFEREREVTEEVEEEYTDEEGNTQTRTVTKVVGTEKFTQYRPWSVDKTAFQLHLVAGWQAHEKLLKEAMTRIEALEAEVAALKGQ